MGQALILSVLMLAGVVLIFVGLMPRRNAAVQIEDRLGTYATRDFDMPKSIDELDMERPFTERVLTPFIKTIGRLIINRTPEKQLEELRRKIILAGSPKGLTPQSFLTMKLVLGGL